MRAACWRSSSAAKPLHACQRTRARRCAPPERADLVLASDVPHSKVDVLVLHSLDVEADRGDGGDDLAKFELVEDRGFTGRVEPHHQDAHLLLGEEALEHTLEGPHGCRQAMRSPLATGVFRVPALLSTAPCTATSKGLVLC